MQPVPAYHPENYPPHGEQWPHFGDPQLDKALASISAEAHTALVKKRVENQPMHMERLQYHNLAPRASVTHVGAAEQPMGETQSDSGFVSAGDAQGEQEEEEPPQSSGIRRMASGIGHVVRNYVYPATRDIIAPAMADAAVHGAKGLIWLTGKSAWTAAQLFWVLSGGEGSFPVGDEPPSGSSSSSQHSLTWNSEADADEVERLSKKGKGFLVEELYRTKGWRKVFEQEDARGYANDESALFRKKLGQMSKRDLAEVLVKLNKNQ